METPAQFKLVYVVCTDQDEARRIARMLVEDHLAACCNFFPCSSVYRWEGKLQEEEEYVLICKTTADRCDDLLRRVRRVHSYRTPAILVLDIKGGDQDFLEWVEQEVSEFVG